MTASAANPVVLEDAAYRDLYFHDPYPGGSILSLKEFESIPYLYLGTLTKPYASGLKVGFGICTDHDWMQRIIWLRCHLDFGTANFNQAILEEILLDGGLDKQTAKLRNKYRGKMEALHEALVAEGVDGLGWSGPSPLEDCIYGYRRRAVWTRGSTLPSGRPAARSMCSMFQVIFVIVATHQPTAFD